MEKGFSRWVFSHLNVIERIEPQVSFFVGPFTECSTITEYILLGRDYY